jgi:hypothetical protein
MPAAPGFILRVILAPTTDPFTYSLSLTLIHPHSLSLTLIHPHPCFRQQRGLAGWGRDAHSLSFVLICSHLLSSQSIRQHHDESGRIMKLTNDKQQLATITTISNDYQPLAMITNN